MNDRQVVEAPAGVDAVMGDAVQAKAVEFIARPRACANDYPIVLAELRPVGVGATARSWLLEASG